MSAPSTAPKYSIGAFFISIFRIDTADWMIALKIKTKYSFTDLFLLLSFILFGSFNEFVSAALSVALLIFLILRIRRTSVLKFKKSILTLFYLLLPIFYGLTAFWAIDKGMAFIGGIKFLPVALYTLALWNSESKEKVTEILPLFAAVLTVVTALAMQFAPFKEIFSVSGRLAGTFSYPNSYALFLLVCELLLIQKKRLAALDIVVLAVLCAGILYTGSRTVLIALVLFNLAYIFICGQKRLKLIIAALLGLIALIIALTVIIQGENSILYRFINVSLKSDTFVGRLLYAADSLPLVLKYPLGMGYMGYFYMQGSIQTGIYSLVYVHNDFLQLLLDIGVIPTLLLIAGLIRWFFIKDIPSGRKLTVGAICFHCLFDFDLQFVSLFMLLVLLTDHSKVCSLPLKRKKSVATVALSLLCIMCIYMSSALGTAQVGLRSLSEKLYPFNTQNKLALLENTEDIEKANTLAEEILLYNKAYYLPYSVKAKHFYSLGKFNSMIEYKRLAIERYPLKYTEYIEYCEMLINGRAVYQKTGDKESADFCKSEIINTNKLFHENKKRIGTLGSMIQNQPWARLPDKITDYIELIE